MNRPNPAPLITVLGGTGRVGAPGIDEFLSQGLNVTILARSPGRVARRFAEATVRRGSMLLESDVRHALDGANAAFLITPVGGNDDPEIELKAAQTAISAAAATRLPHLIYLSLIQPPRPTGVAMLDVKGRVERLIQSSGLPWSSLRTGCYMEAWLNFFPRLMKMGIYLFPIGSRHRFSFTAQRDPARLAAHLIRQNRVLNDALDVIEPHTRTLRNVVDLYTAVSGRHLQPVGGWLLPVLKVLKPLFFKRFYPTGASRVSLFSHFNENDWVGDPSRLAEVLPEFQVTTMETRLYELI